MESTYDIAIIGGGINGCGIAADAAMRGLKILLIEKDDLASKTSSSSSKLIHGGLRYLEQYDFSLVRKALAERQTLMEIAPHLVHPLPIVLPYEPHSRSTWLLRFGFFLYDHLSRKNTLPSSHWVERQTSPLLFNPLLQQCQKGFLYYDCVTDDARLTLSNALQAQQFGGTIQSYTELVQAEWIRPQWKLTLKNTQQGIHEVRARIIINATGPWVKTVNERLGLATDYSISLIKGSHIVVPKLYEGDHAYLLQNDDQRIVFVLPFHHRTLIGTTEITLDNPVEPIFISQEETTYLLKLMHHYFKKIIQPNDILSSWSGIRPLIGNKQNSIKSPHTLSRDYTLQFLKQPAPTLIVYGGKITTYRQLAAEAIDLLTPLFPSLPKSQTQKTPLPGSNTPDDKIDFLDCIESIKAQYAWLEASTLQRLIQTYGTRVEVVLHDCMQAVDLGKHFGHGLYQVEVDYLINQEWARTVEDILWRRTKLGLEFDQKEKRTLEAYVLKIGATS